MTVFVDDVVAVVGKVIVVEPAVAGADIVTEPLVSPFITTDAIIYPYKITQRLPLGIVIVTPVPTVIGPAEEADLFVVSV